MIEVSEAQVRSFRSLRGHLSGPGAADPAAAARAIVGVQAQVEGPAWWAASMRTATRPTAAAIKAAWVEHRTLIRTWAQRDTLHLFGVEDWPWFAAATPRWHQTGRGTVRAPDEVLVLARERLREAAHTRSDLVDLVTDTMREEMALRVGEEQAERYAAGRIPWQLAHLGEVCLGPKRGSEQSYVHRDHWLDDTAGFVRDHDDAAVELLRRYLAAHGPATAQDAAHFFGARVSLTRGWFERLADATVAVRCEDRSLVALQDDVDALQVAPTPAPARLVAGYDTLLMSHADKSWTTPHEPDRKAVWKRSAVVAATVVADGRIVATWTHKARKSGVTVTVTPLSGWSEAHIPAIKVDAARFAEHLQVAGATVVMA